MSNKIIPFPTQIMEYGDMFHAVMDICLDVQLNGRDHLAATVSILEVVEEYYKNKEKTASL